MMKQTRCWFVLIKNKREQSKGNLEDCQPPFLSCSRYLSNLSWPFLCLPWKMSSLYWRHEGEPCYSVLSHTPRGLNTLTCALECNSSSQLTGEWWNMFWSNLLLQDDGRGQIVLARSSVAHFEQGMSKKGLCIAAGPLEHGHRHLGVHLPFRGSLLPWDAPINLGWVSGSPGS